MRYLVFLLLMAFVFTIPWENGVVIEELGTLSRGIGLAAFAVGICACLMTMQFRRLILLHYLQAAFVVLSALSLFWSQDVNATIGLAWTYAQLLVLAWLIWEFTPDAFRQKLLMHAYIWGCGVSILMQMLGYQTTTQQVQGVGEGVSRVSAAGMNANNLAVILVFSLPMAVYFGSHPKVNKVIRIAYWLYCPLCLYGVLFTSSRTGMIIAALAGTYLIFVHLWKRPIYGVALIFLATVIVATAPIYLPEANQKRLFDTIEKIQTGNWTGRLEILDTGLNVYSKYPVLGTGSGAFIAAAAAEGGTSFVIGSHNDYLGSLVELGWLGFMLFVSILFVALRYALKMPKSEMHAWLCILIVLYVVEFVCSLLGMKPFWLLLGLLASQYAAFKQEGTERQKGVSPAPLVSRRAVKLPFNWKRLPKT
jgi:O-antigen ligase